MNKIIHKIAGLALGLSLAVGVGVALGSRKASEAKADEVAYTLTPASGSNNSYAGNCDITISGVTWNLTGNSTMQPWRIGGKNLSGADRALYSKTAISDDITKIEVTHGAASSITVNSWTVIVSTAQNGGGTVVSTLTPTFATNTTTTITRPEGKSWANCFYKFVYNVTVGSSNKFIEFSQAKFYKESGGSGSTYYTVDFDTQGHGTQPESQQVEDGGQPTNPGDLSADGWVFGGWYHDADCGTEWDFSADTIDGDTTIYAKWTENSFGDSNKYTLIKDVADLEKGKNYLIGNVSGTAFISTTQNNNNRGVKAASPVASDGKVSLQTGMEVFELGGSEGAWTLEASSSNAPGYLYAASSSGNHLKTRSSNSDKNSEWAISISNDGTASIVAQGSYTRNVMQYNSSSSLFACYASASQGAVSLWKEPTSVDPSLKTMVIKQSGTAADGASYDYKASGTYTFAAYEESAQLTDVTWSVDNSEVATIDASTGALATVAPGTATITAQSDGYNNATASITISKGTLQSIAVSGAMSKTAYTTNDTAWNSAGLVATGTYSTGWQETLSDVNWTFTPSVPAEGVTSVVAHAAVGSVSNDSEAQTVSVTVAHAGTAQDPFTVAEALAKANEIGAVGNSGQGPWVTKGIITRVTSAPAATYWNATYYISDDGTQNNELQVYRGFYINNAKFDETTAQLLKAGKIVTVTGNLTGSYGCEYCANNYMLSLEDASTGDVDVTFEPELSIEVGATGTYTASSQIQGVTYEWSVDDADVLSVNSSTGAYEALSAGTARVTVTATANNKTGETHADIVVNGNSSDIKSIAFANSCASGLDNNKTTPNYWYFKAYVTGFDADSQARAISVSDINETDSIILFIGKSGYSTFISGMELGRCLVFKAQVQNYGGTYELQNPELVSSNYSSLSFANEFLSGTDAVCDGYKDGDDNSTALGNIWDGFETSYNGLSEAEQAHLINTSGCGATIVGAMARYDHLIKAYPSLEAFVTNRVSNGVNGGYRIANSLDSNSSTIIIAVVAFTSITSIGVLLVIKRKRSLVK